jgi:predicted enzyme related to lactoylglutathione lyase
MVAHPDGVRRTAMLEGATANTTLPAMDMARAAQFYTEKVGAVPGESREGGSDFSVGNSTFSIYPTANPNRGGHTQMGLRVPDARAAVAELRSRGVVFEEYDLPGLKTVDGIADVGGASAAWFKDTEGNIIGIVQINS